MQHVHSSAGAAWWRDTVIYQVYPRSFADGNGDGTGDLAGLRTRLPYLRDLGVDALWITPFYSSPMVDGGFDVADHRTIDPLFGDLTDAEALIDDAHALGLRVIVDLVPNHTSDQHPWFQRALREGPGSALRERYHFRPGRGTDGELPPNDWESVFGGPAWTRTTDPDGTPGDWYLHLFAPEMPDLDFDSPAVQDEFRSIIRFWLDRGADGLRIADAHGLVKAAGLPDLGRTAQAGLLGSEAVPYFDQDGVHEIHRAWRRILDGYPGERIAIAEAVTPDADRLARYVRADELHHTQNFDYLSAPWEAEALRATIERTLTAHGAVGAVATWGLGNADVHRVVTRYGDDAPGLRRARAAALLTLALPGAAYIYQGDELGLPEVLDLPEEALRDPQWERSGHTERGRDGCRVPLPWNGDAAPYGFGPDDAAPTWLPQPEAWAKLSVAAQTEDPASMLTLYRAALQIRREEEGLGDGPLDWRTGPQGTLVFGRGDGFVCTVNTGDRAAELPRPGELLLASSPFDVSDGERITLPADTAAWWRAQ
ncbi:alpha-amylase family glycosyl hydrolase [Streptomyces sp. NK08204]|uniref:glycoside hydrolase family 13 protein n=1 Tax=Streptomyces sp. NK08204 TaxID=2873260 RepID=UPI001CECCFAF|nr:alpha-amylase family glycosyl hydrolase [Streptomyces sp. NK08204]